MTRFLGAVLTVIAVGVLLIAYGLLRPPVSASASPWIGGPGAGLVTDPRGDTYQLARPMYTTERVELSDANANRYGSGRTPAPYELNDPRRVPEYANYPAAPRPTTTSRVERSSGRDWMKTALVIGGTTAAGAGVGAMFGGKKGALIGAAIGGGASSIYEARKR